MTTERIIYSIVQITVVAIYLYLIFIKIDEMKKKINLKYNNLNFRLDLLIQQVQRNQALLEEITDNQNSETINEKEND